MPKPSKHIDLKPEIEEHFRQGKTAYDIVKMYPYLSPGTTYNWFKSFAEHHPECQLKQVLSNLDSVSNKDLSIKTLREIMSSKTIKNDPKLTKYRLQAALKLLEIDQSIDEDKPKDLVDDITNFFGEHIRLNEIKRPLKIEVHKSRIIGGSLDTKFSVRGYVYTIIGESSNNWICQWDPYFKDVSSIQSLL